MKYSLCLFFMIGFIPLASSEGQEPREIPGRFEEVLIAIPEEQALLHPETSPTMSNRLEQLNSIFDVVATESHDNMLDSDGILCPFPQDQQALQFIRAHNGCDLRCCDACRELLQQQ